MMGTKMEVQRLGAEVALIRKFEDTRYKEFHKTNLYRCHLVSIPSRNDKSKNLPAAIFMFTLQIV